MGRDRQSCPRTDRRRPASAGRAARRDAPRGGSALGGWVAVCVALALAALRERVLVVVVATMTGLLLSASHGILGSACATTQVARRRAALSHPSPECAG